MPEISPFEFVKSINEKKTDLTEEISSYVPFLINRALNVSADSLFNANDMNQRPGLGKDQQYKFLMEAVSKGKRYGEWLKIEKDEKVMLLMAKYSYSKKRATEVARFFTDEDMKEILKSMETGGVFEGKNKKKNS